VDDEIIVAFRGPLVRRLDLLELRQIRHPRYSSRNTTFGSGLAIILVGARRDLA
jgi:hypothetical protein